MQDLFEEPLTRIGLGLAAIATLAWFLWPSSGWKFEPEPAVAFASAAVVWLASELKSARRVTPHPHDVEFIRMVRALIPLDAVRYLQQQDFGASYNNDRLDGFWHLDFDAQAIGFGPHHKKLKRKFDDLRAKIHQLSILLATHGGPIKDSSKIASIVPDRERATDEFSDDTTALVRSVNNLADEVAEAYDQFMRTSRHLVPDAFLAHPSAVSSSTTV